MAARTPLFTGYGYFPQQAPADAIMARLMVCSYQVLATVPGFPLEGSRAPPLRRRTVINSNLSLGPGPGEDRRLTWWTFPDKPLVVFPYLQRAPLMRACRITWRDHQFPWKQCCGPAGSRDDATFSYGDGHAACRTGDISAPLSSTLIALC